MKGEDRLSKRPSGWKRVFDYWFKGGLLPVNNGATECIKSTAAGSRMSWYSDDCLFTLPIFWSTDRFRPSTKELSGFFSFVIHSSLETQDQVVFFFLRTRLGSLESNRIGEDEYRRYYPEAILARFIKIVKFQGLPLQIQKAVC